MGWKCGTHENTGHHIGNKNMTKSKMKVALTKTTEPEYN